jgi:hypothetical protein
MLVATSTEVYSAIRSQLAPWLEFDPHIHLMDAHYTLPPPWMVKELIKKSPAKGMEQDPGFSDCDDRGFVLMGHMRTRFYRRRNRWKRKHDLQFSPTMLLAVDNSHVRVLVMMEDGFIRFIEPGDNTCFRPRHGFPWSDRVILCVEG